VRKRNEQRRPEITDMDWLRFFEDHILTGVRLSHFYPPPMLQRDWGRVVFISSESGLNIPAEMIHYGVTKMAQIALAPGLAETTADTDVTVNLVMPGPTRSEGVEPFVQDPARGQGVDKAKVEADFFRTARRGRRCNPPLRKRPTSYPARSLAFSPIR
jgi:NAD(P)-dependent dehydrogenase (short-subunit alcohol dehydrogenase family)